MSKALSGPALAMRVVIPWIGVLMMLLSLDANAQSTVDDDQAYCQSRTLEELVHEIRADMKASRQSGPLQLCLYIFKCSFVNHALSF